ncbi:MAG: conjugal transfer protein TraN [Proteobacteria bacterium]|nr:conjugal transfer protein TraN [Pseudomonadota bacterium]
MINKTISISISAFIASLSFVPISLYAEGVPSGCTYTGQTCIEQGSVKHFGGVDIYSDCWKYQQHYSCSPTPINECAPYEQSCKLGAFQKCLLTIGGQCVEYLYTYECPKQVCDGTSLYCGSDIFCIDGDCTKPKPTQNKNFGQDASELAAVAGAATDFNNNGQVSLFNGKPMECSIDIANFKDCCKDSGWGTDIGLGSCDDNEKKLGSDKEHYLVTYIGEYCHNKVLGVCTSKHKVYCVWDSKMARITQDYGRGQLSMNFGSPESPNCSGLTIDQFQKINFNAVDFIDPIYIYPDGSHNKSAGLAGDMKVSAPDAQAMADQINKRIEEDMKNKTPSSDKKLSSKVNELQSAILSQI